MIACLMYPKSYGRWALDSLCVPKCGNGIVVDVQTEEPRPHMPTSYTTHAVMCDEVSSWKPYPKLTLYVPLGGLRLDPRGAPARAVREHEPRRYREAIWYTSNDSRRFITIGLHP